MADPLAVSRLLTREPHAVVVSARSGDGLHDVLAAIEADLPRPSVRIDALVPYARGDLINKMHEYGEVTSVEHTADGTRVRGLVNPRLAGEFEPFATTSASAAAAGWTDD
ncbi:MAG: hypothetical protein H0U28_05595 [Nocardioidaceae bacterium]|nr:hypothetical protein [Nocardioidaceae bacterium]